MNVVERQIALFARQSNEVFDFFTQIAAGLALDRSEQLFGIGEGGIRQKSRFRFGVSAGGRFPGTAACYGGR